MDPETDVAKKFHKLHKTHYVRKKNPKKKLQLEIRGQVRGLCKIDVSETRQRLTRGRRDLKIKSNENKDLLKKRRH